MSRQNLSQPVAARARNRRSFVLRVDGKYYLYATTDTKGYEVFVSDDLVHWQRKARAFEDPRGGAWRPRSFTTAAATASFTSTTRIIYPSGAAFGEANRGRRLR